MHFGRCGNQVSAGTKEMLWQRRTKTPAHWPRKMKYKTVCRIEVHHRSAAEKQNYFLTRWRIVFWIFICALSLWYHLSSQKSNESKGVRKAGGLGLTPPLALGILQKLYYQLQRKLIVSHTFCLLIYRLNANNTEWICMQISRNIVNGPKSNN